jgi:Tol biopolymer transport system component
VSITINKATAPVANGLIAFPDKDAQGNINLFLIDQWGTGRTQLTTGPGPKVLPWWAPDGKSLVYEQLTGASIFSGDVYTINVDGTGQHLIASNAAMPAWSPLGASISFARMDTFSGRADIWTASPDGTGQAQLTHLSGPFVAAHASYSPDGNHILYTRAAADGSTNTSLWIMDAGGTSDYQLTTGIWNNLDTDGNIINTANDANVGVWGPDNTIAFWAGVRGSYGQIWTINPDGSGRKQLTHIPAGYSADEPAWSPDGIKLLYTNNASATPGIWVMDADGTDQHLLTQTAAGSPPAVPYDAAWQAVSVVPATPVAFATPILATTDFGANSSGGGQVSQDQHPRIVADVNGDGRADIVAFGETGAYTALGQADGTFAAPHRSGSNFGSEATGGGWATQNQYPRLLGDVNGDGRADIVGFGFDGAFTALGQVDGAFGPLIAASSSFGLGAAAGGWISEDQYPRLLGDVNGDGRDDIVGFGHSGVTMALGQSDGTFAQPAFGIRNFGSSDAAGGWSSNNLYPRFAADVNGDDRADIVGFAASGVFVALSQVPLAAAGA